MAKAPEFRIDGGGVADVHGETFDPEIGWRRRPIVGGFFLRRRLDLVCFQRDLDFTSVSEGESSGDLWRWALTIENPIVPSLPQIPNCCQEEVILVQVRL